MSNLAPWNDPSVEWVCEDHPTKEQSHRLWFGFGPECGGAGMPAHDMAKVLSEKLDEVLRRLSGVRLNDEGRSRLRTALKGNRSRQQTGAGDVYWESVIDTCEPFFIGKEKNK